MTSHGPLTDLEKLEHLLGHWVEHNEAHMKNYQEWVVKAEALGDKELSQVLAAVVRAGSEQGALLRKALQVIQGT